MITSLIIGLLATFLSVPMFFFIVWFVDRFKPDGWTEKHLYDADGKFVGDNWGYKTKMVLIVSVFLGWMIFLFWFFF